jgi:hypothetical protein
MLMTMCLLSSVSVQQHDYDYILVMRQVPGAALDHAAGRVEVHPQEEAQVRPLQVVVDGGVREDLQQLVHAEDGLADRLDEAVLALQGTGFYLYVDTCANL